MKKCFTPDIKLLKVMKICTLQIVLAMTLTGLAQAHITFAQVLDKQITMTLKEVSIDEALGAIEKLVNIRFYYSIDQLNIQENVSIVAVDTPLGDVLDKLLRPYGIQYKVHENKSAITLKRKYGQADPGVERQGAETSRLAPPLTPVTINGTIIDEATQRPMAGVNILEKGTTNGTVSDIEGNYAITVNEGSVLVFSFIGYRIYEVQVNGSTVINVTLEEDVSTLQTVTINAGYWEVNRHEATGNISHLGEKEISRQPVFNPIAAIQGRMPGVFITETSGVPGSGFRLQIRGQNSLRAEANEPLYIVDGVPFSSSSILERNPSALRLPSPLSVINPADIESIEVLKDADATAIYGSRGSNGVVLITTKKAKKGKTHIDANFSYGFGEVANRLDLLTTEQYLEMRNEAFLNDGQSPGTTDHDVNGSWDQLRYTDWQELLYGGTANYTNAQASISGGNESTTFLFSGNYNHQTTVFPGDMEYGRGSGHISLNHRSDDKKFGFNFSATFAAENNGLGFVNYFDLIYDLAPNAPAIYDGEGNLNWENSTWENPFADLHRKYKSNIHNLITNATIRYEVLSGFRLKTSLGYNSIHSKESNLYPITAQNPSNSPAGSASFSRGGIDTWIIEPQAEYNLDLNSGNLLVLLGSTFQANNRETMGITASGYENDELLENLAAGPRENLSAMNQYAEYRYSALYARINFNWKKKYIINLTGRRDGSSRFGSGRQFANFGAVGLAWVFTNEPFMKSLSPYFSFGKIRTSFGVTGSDQIGDYGYFDSYESLTGQFQYEGSSTLQPARLANPNYAWESNVKAEGAVELGLFDGRVTMSTSYYRNRSSNQLVGLPLPGTTGFSSMQYNLNATVENTGWEFELSALNMKSNDFEWNTGLNMSVPRNKLIEYPNLESSPHATSFVIGKPLNVVIRYSDAGIDPVTGVYSFDDLDGDGTLTSSDRIKPVAIGLSYYGGITNTLKYKSLELDFSIQFVNQTSGSYRTRFTTPGRMGNQPMEVLDRWQQEGDESMVQKYTSRTGTPNTAHTRWISSDDAVDDSSYIRLKTVSLSWYLPKRLIQNLSLESVMLYTQGRNLLTLTKYKGLDPEGHLGVLRVVTAGIQIQF